MLRRVNLAILRMACGWLVSSSLCVCDIAICRMPYYLCCSFLSTLSFPTSFLPLHYPSSPSSSPSPHSSSLSTAFCFRVEIPRTAHASFAPHSTSGLRDEAAGLLSFRCSLHDRTACVIDSLIPDCLRWSIARSFARFPFLFKSTSITRADPPNSHLSCNCSRLIALACLLALSSVIVLYDGIM